MCQPEIALHLHLEPEVWRGSERGRQSQRHERGDAGSPIENSREVRTGDAQPFRRFPYADALKIISQDFTGMCWVKDHLPSMVVLVVDQNDILSLKQKCHPVTTHRDRPMAFQLAFQRVQVVSRSVHVVGARRGVQRREKSSQSLGVLGLNSRPRSSLGKLLQSFVPIAQDYPYSVWLRYTEKNIRFTEASSFSSP